MPQSIKYRPLENFLKTCSEELITLSYSEIEELLNDKLPPSAYKRSEWWDNRTHSHTQMWSWRNAGWEVIEKKLGVSITFKKIFA